MDCYKDLLIYLMFNTSNNNNVTTRILELIKHPAPDYFFILSNTRIQCVTLTKGKVLIFHPSVQEDFCIGIGFRKKV